jgi:hypothetical protein
MTTITNKNTEVNFKDVLTITVSFKNEKDAALYEKNSKDMILGSCVTKSNVEFVVIPFSSLLN